jgi:hypothetical protein
VRRFTGILDKSWEELGVIINGTLDNIASEILIPTVDFQALQILRQYYGHLGRNMLRR